MKEVEIVFKFEDEHYQMLEEEASTINMSVKELIANAFSVIFQEIQDDVEARRNADQQTS